MKVTDDMVAAARKALFADSAVEADDVDTYSMRVALEAALGAAPPPADPDSAIEQAIEDAADHGRESDPDHEVGDLQGVVRLLWSLLTPEQRHTFVDRWEAWG